MPIMKFIIESIPDLSLNKYGSFDESDVSGVLRRHNAFLRQLNRKSILSSVSFHLIYQFEPNKKSGIKLTVQMIAQGEVEGLKYITKLIQNSSLAPFYQMICITTGVIEEIDKKMGCLLINSDGLVDTFKYNQSEFNEFLLNDIVTVKSLHNEILEVIQVKEDVTYSHCSVLSKKEYFITPSLLDDRDPADFKFYNIATWEVNQGARLYGMFKLMQALNEPVMFRIDLFPFKTEKLRNTLPLQELRNRTQFRTEKSGNATSLKRNDEAEELLKIYSQLLKDYESSPHFIVNIIALANSQEIANLIIDAAGAESLNSGSYSITEFKQEKKFNLLSMTKEPINVASKSTPTQLSYLTNLFLLKEVMPFFVLPVLYDGESIELPKETAPSYHHNGISLGLDETGHPVSFPVELFAKHAFIAGVPGSGKTNTMLHLASSLWKQYKIPFLIFEPAKQEYRALVRIPGMEELLVFSPSAGTKFPLRINPFSFPIGLSVSEHIGNLVQVFDGAFSLWPPLDIILDKSIEAVYENKGWKMDMLNTGTYEYPTMQELYEQVKIDLDKLDYGEENKGNMTSALHLRIGSLLRRGMGALFNVQESSMTIEDLLKKPVLFELESMGTDKANFLTLLLSNLIREYLKVNSDKALKLKLKHVLFFEEAHNLIGPVSVKGSKDDGPNTKVAATEFIVKMLAEVRALGEGIIIADQLPSVMAPEVLKNTGLKIGHRITASDDKNQLGNTMSATALQLDQVSTYLPGEALILYEGLLKPFKVQMRQLENGADLKDGKDLYYSPTDKELLELLNNNTNYYERMTNKNCYELYLKEFKELFQELTKLRSAIVTIQKDTCIHKLEKIIGNKNVTRIEELKQSRNEFEFEYDRLSKKEVSAFFVGDDMKINEEVFMEIKEHYDELTQSILICCKDRLNLIEESEES